MSDTQTDAPQLQTLNKAPDSVFALTLDDADRMPFLELAELAGQSNFFACNNKAQAAMKLLLGRELGFQPCASLSGIHIVEGRPMIGANMYAAAIKRHADYDYKAMVSAEECSIHFFRVDAEGKREELGTYSITIQEAKERGWTHSNSGTPKANWRRHPDAMLFARAISQGVRFHMPDVFGGMPVYTEGEFEAEPEIVQAEIVEGPEDLPEKPEGWGGGE